ncbi:YccF domain-containing protein [Arachidicoccus soli]|uniref:YccF domain-containing protein n=1 Tax=Arachidicoccus soli TaxID=2341117 RepID=UPI001968D16B
MFSGFILCSTIVGIPFWIQCFKIGFASLAPFGLEIYDKKQDISGGCITRIFNVVWIFLGGIWIALTHFGFGPLFCITIIGIPFGNRHFKLIPLSSPLWEETRLINI